MCPGNVALLNLHYTRLMWELEAHVGALSQALPGGTKHHLFSIRNFITKCKK